MKIDLCIRGPALDEIEVEEHTRFEPGGFQVIEEYLYPEFDASSRSGLVREIRKMNSILERAKELWSTNQFRNDQVFDALRLQCFRMITLGISGFDTPVSEMGISELPTTLQSIQDQLVFYHTDSSTLQHQQLSRLLDGAKKFATLNADFDSFDRMQFITQYINPFTTLLLALQKQLRVPVLTNINALNGDIKTLFDENAFNINYFTPDANSFVSESRISLGKRLFYDNILSGNNLVSCASCHKPEKAFTDGLTKSRALASRGFLLRNTPTLINAGLQKAQFYDMRASFLEDQVKNVVENKDEIHGSLKDAAILLTEDLHYKALFQKAYPGSSGVISERQIQVALAGYIRSLTSFNSRFDLFMRGDTGKMNKEERDGFNMFMGKAKCGICHFMPLFNGTVPPQFNTTESEVIGVAATADNKKIDSDKGRYSIYNIPNLERSFKTSTLRNIDLTAPYMHNGAYKTLEDVVAFYEEGGGNGFGFNLEYQTLPEDKLELTDYEKRSLVSFMKTLTDTACVRK
ncbi:MAG: cytochrome c peroxidase [Chitinophagaceae bacterium]